MSSFGSQVSWIVIVYFVQVMCPHQKGGQKSLRVSYGSVFQQCVGGREGGREGGKESVSREPIELSGDKYVLGSPMLLYAFSLSFWCPQMS